MQNALRMFGRFFIIVFLYFFMKALRPSLRENKRYLFIRGTDVRRTAEQAILDFVGVLGYAKASPGWIKGEKDSAILSINRESLEVVRAALVLGEKPLVIERVSGTLKGLGKR